MSDTDRCWAVVPAAGAGKRMQADIPKQYLTLGGQSILEHTLSRLLNHPGIEKVYVALSPEDEYWSTTRYAADSRVVVVPGGAERCHSVYNAIQQLTMDVGDGGWVLVHDAARPLLQKGDIDRLITRVISRNLGGILAVPLHDTIKRADLRQQRIEITLPREQLWRAFTPQMFRVRDLAKALDTAFVSGELVTDEASAIEGIGGHPLLVEGAVDNIKITRPEDLALAEFLLADQERRGVA